MTDWTTPINWNTGTDLDQTNLNTYIRDNQLHLKERQDHTAVQFRNAAGDYTTTATTPTDLDAELDLDLTTVGGDVMVTFAGYGYASTGRRLYVGFLLDGATEYTPIVAVDVASSGIYANLSFSYILTGLSAGSHNFKIRAYMSGAGTMTVPAGQTLFDVREINGLAS